MISIIIVTYNSQEYIERCIESIYSNTDMSDTEIIVVDNASTDRTVNILYNKYRNIRLIRNKRNTGYASANNKGIRRSHGEYIMLLNPDTYFVNDAPHIMKDFLKNNPEAGCAGSRLEYFNGKLQLSCRKFPTFINVFFGRKSIFRHIFPGNPISRKYMMQDLDYNKNHRVDWVMGASMMLKREVTDKCGLFDEDYFLFAEDTDLCYRMHKKDYKIYYVPRAIVRHYHGGSVVKKVSVSHIHHNISMYKFFRKHSLIGKTVFDIPLYFALLTRLLFIVFSEAMVYTAGSMNLDYIMNRYILRR